MKALQRLYLSEDRSLLVAEGDARAASLYAGVGDEIPESAVEKFGLEDGGLVGSAAVAAIVDAILRAATSDGTTIAVGLLTFTGEFVYFVSDAIDEGQLLAILETDLLKVEARLEGVADGWIEFPGRAEVIDQLKVRVAADLEAGRPHALVGLKASPRGIAKAGAASGKPVKAKAVPKPAAPKKPATAKAGAKEAPPGENKEQKGGEDKGAGTPPASPPAPTESASGAPQAQA